MGKKWSGSGWEIGIEVGEGVIAGGEGAVELEVLEVGEDGFEGRAGLVAAVDEIFAGDEGRRDEGLVGELLGLGLEELVVVVEAVAGGAVDAVEFEFLVEVGCGHEALEFGGAHILDVHELHVAVDGVDGGVDDVVGEAVAAEDVSGHFGTESVVAVEADPVLCGIVGVGGGFGDVVEEDGKDEC